MQIPQPAEDTAGEVTVSGNVGRLAATIDRLRREIHDAQLAAEGRALIALARGVLVERLRCGPTQAAQQLAALAEQAGLSQLELATDIINQTAQDRLSDAARDFLTRTGAEARDAGASSVAVRLRTAESGVLYATDSQMVAESLLEHALAPLGATAVAMWAAGPDASLTLAGYAGFSAEEARRWRYVPPGVATPARRALVERQTVWFSSLSEPGLPSIGQRQLSGGGRVTIPAGTGGRILGVLEICWPQPLQPQPPQIHKQMEALAELCAHTLEAPADQRAAAPHMAELIDLVDALPDPALVLTPQLDDGGRLTDFRIHHSNSRFADPAGRPRGVVTGALLLEAYPLAAGDSGLLEKIEHVHATGEPFRAEGMTLTALADQVPLTTLADISLTRHGDCILLIWRVQDEVVRLASLLQHAQRLGRIGGFEENAQTGEITWNSQLYELYGLTSADRPIPLERLRERAHPDDATAIGRFLRTVLHHRHPSATAFRLQRDDGIIRHIRVVAEPVFDADGRMAAIRGAYQDISAQHWTEVALAATRDRLALSEQQVDERNRLTLQLQHAIMPPARGPVEAFGLHIAVRYRPAEKEHLIGGDWYDTFILPSKQILLSVGDIAGHGIEAATGMVILRNALRGLAATGAGPAQLLTWLNLVAHHLTESVTATAVCGLYDPTTRVLRWARAGHLPPVLIRRNRATELSMIGGILLGAVSDADYAEERIQLERDDTLLMYTDGLIERRDRSLQHSQAQLLITAEHPTASLDHRLDHLLTHCNSDTDDDTCLIGVQLH
ncbi:PP2C family protein-serine/threonine phosphatase [Streptosporangium lutulentum]|uniref:Serine phosphatase RsbU (Regulator of sigma subunit)/PAS domain-containing protein n=1 Tax=Streptosporangium lutulentum TaxID=1461250 RepID=A0ABT9Q8Y4_9ACTN|nr:PP2C family protein-serine/threonine phosphatase [Streptosporangium lutulentum]MDP9842409.1 serine phosphatase RsbU (regulator of sigma subunit)/PAS domain-containing protein [Streptosporangium lutulentum]